jgi:hypothetical protein
MNSIDILERKIRQAAEELVSLRQEREKLKAEVEFLLEENKRAQRAISENEALRGERKAVSVKIEKLIKRINATVN